MRKQIHPHSQDTTILHTNGATTWSFASRLNFTKDGPKEHTRYEISDVDVFLVRKVRGAFINESALSRFKKR